MRRDGDIIKPIQQQSRDNKMSFLVRTKMLKSFLSASLLLPLLAFNNASAHTVTIGYTPGTGTGEVNLWVGSYHGDDIGDGPNLEGSMHLFGVNGTTFDATVPFNIEHASGTPPSGLVVGTNMFFSPSYLAGSCGGSTTDCLAQLNSWEGVTISGLSAGDYQFSYIAPPNASAHWADWGDLGSLTIHLTTGDIGGGGDGGGNDVPEPETLALLGIGLLGVGLSKRKKQS